MACIHRSEGFFLRSFHSLVHVHSFAFSQPSIRGHQRDVPASKDLGIFHMDILGSNLGKGGVVGNLDWGRGARTLAQGLFGSGGG